MAAALSTAIAGGEQIVILGRRESADTQAMWVAANRKYRPFAVVTRVDPDQQAAVAEHMPWIAQMRMIGNQATVFVCRGFACDAPSTDPGVLA